MVLVSLTGCNVLQSGLQPEGSDASTAQEAGPGETAAGDTIEPTGITDTPVVVGCSDGSREGFRDVARWPHIAGCAGAFGQPGVIGPPAWIPTCKLMAGDQGIDKAGQDCSAADLCAAGWHVCRDSGDVASHSPTGDCEGCVPPSEHRFFVVAKAASPMGICSADPNATNDLHGCGTLGEPEVDECAPLDRRMTFADCLATGGVWKCGSADNDSLQEAVVVTKPGITLGGVLCCSD